MARKPLIKLNIYLALASYLILMLIIYALCRLGFYAFNTSFFPNMYTAKLSRIILGGVKFDIVALAYLNSLFILLQTLPFTFRFRKGYQRFCKRLFIVTNSVGVLLNFVDIPYYQFTLKRTTASAFSQFSNEQNKAKLGISFLLDYWYLVILFALVIWGLTKLYSLISIKKENVHNIFLYGSSRTIIMLLIATLVVFGMRGGWRHSTRPITLSNAGEFVDTPDEMNLVLNTPFTIMKTIGIKTLSEKNYFDKDVLEKIYTPIHYPRASNEAFKPLNVVVLIVESLGLVK